jgi:hypothetical protein
MRVAEFVSSRVAAAVVHGIGLTRACRCWRPRSSPYNLGMGFL